MVRNSTNSRRDFFPLFFFFPQYRTLFLLFEVQLLKYCFSCSFKSQRCLDEIWVLMRNFCGLPADSQQGWDKKMLAVVLHRPLVVIFITCQPGLAIYGPHLRVNYKSEKQGRSCPGELTEHLCGSRWSADRHIQEEGVNPFPGNLFSVLPFVFSRRIPSSVLFVHHSLNFFVCLF